MGLKYRLKVDLCMSKGKQPRTKVKVPKLLFSENQEGTHYSQSDDRLRSSHNLKTS